MKKALEFLKLKVSNSSSKYIVVACSGGPDSMALLHVCMQIREEYNLSIVCAHVNHNVRKESEKESDFVKAFCKKHDIIFEYMKIEQYDNDNFENEARIKRYKYFDNLMQKYKAFYLLTAHHGDDLIETILMRITRGSTLKGYSGFSQVVKKDNYEIIRPLIYYTKDELIEYNTKNKIDYVIDGTNSLDIHTRNRYRKYILPKLKKEDNNVHEKFLKFSNVLVEYDNFVNNTIQKEKKRVYQDNILCVKSFLELEKFVAIRVLQIILEEYYQNELFFINDKHVEILYNFICSNKVNATLHFPNKIEVIKSYNGVYFKKREDGFLDYEIELADTTLLPNGRSLNKICEIDSTSNFVCRLNSEELKMPLIVRNRRIGDKIQIKGMTGTKKVKDIFINEKIPFEEREMWPVVVDGSGKIIWLPGLKKTQFDKKKNEKYDIIIKYD